MWEEGWEAGIQGKESGVFLPLSLTSGVAGTRASPGAEKIKPFPSVPCECWASLLNGLLGQGLGLSVL